MLNERGGEKGQCNSLCQHHHRFTQKKTAARRISGTKVFLNHIVSCYTNVTNHRTSCINSVCTEHAAAAPLYILFLTFVVNLANARKSRHWITFPSESNLRKIAILSRLCFPPELHFHLSNDIELYLFIFATNERKKRKTNEREATGWNMNVCGILIWFFVINHIFPLQINLSTAYPKTDKTECPSFVYMYFTEKKHKILAIKRFYFQWLTLKWF